MSPTNPTSASCTPAMINSHNRPIRIGTAFRDGKLYSFSARGVLVASQWPDMRAWRKTPKGRQWKHVRPEMNVAREPDGWGCVWGHREPRQRTGIGGDHILGRLETVLHYPPTSDEGVAFDDMDAGRPGAVEDEPGSEDWMKCAEERERRLQAEYLSPIPDEILVAVSRFANRHWHLLNLVARCPGALDLVRSTPALALALSSPWVFRKRPPSHPYRAARSLLVRHQTCIAAWLGFPETWSAVKILRKLPPQECTVLNLLNLRDLFLTHQKTLQHIPRLNGSILRLLAGDGVRYRTSPGFVQEITSQPGLLDRTMRILRDTLWMGDKLEAPGVIGLRTFKHLTRTHDQFVDQLGRMDLRIISPPPSLHPRSIHTALTFDWSPWFRRLICWRRELSKGIA